MGAAVVGGGWGSNGVAVGGGWGSNGWWVAVGELSARLSEAARDTCVG